jgi:23S rRNA (pseudouridine1915-N3)-methyltransferase
MKVQIFFPHKVRSRPLQELAEHYVKLASRLVSVEIRSGSFCDGKGRPSKPLVTRLREGDAVLLTERGGAVDSHWFRAALESTARDGQPLLFVVGDASGVPRELEAACRRKIALTPLTLPHELALVVLLEQVWRATSMLCGHPYHK